MAVVFRGRILVEVLSCCSVVIFFCLGVGVVVVGVDEGVVVVGVTEVVGFGVDRLESFGILKFGRGILLGSLGVMTSDACGLVMVNVDVVVV